VLRQSFIVAKLILFTGKGGVGKSSVSAATAFHHANEGFKVLLVSSDPAHSTEDVVGKSVGTTPTLIKDNLWAMNISSQKEAEYFLTQIESYFENTVTKWFPGFDSKLLTEWATFPGMDEVFALEKITELTQSIEYDLIVFDTAPTGHTLKALTTPDSMNRFILRIIRMRSKIEKLKTFFIKKDDTDKMIQFLQNTIDRIERIKKLLKDDRFVSFNLVSIATEAGFQECIKTINFLKANNFSINNVVINHLVPDFEEDVWEASATNKAVSLIKMEYELQKPYRIKYQQLCESENINLVGLYKVPFQPMGERLNDFCKLIWNSKGMDYVCEKSFEITEGNGETLELILKIPNTDLLKLNSDGYNIDWNHYKFPSELRDYEILHSRKLKNGYKIIFEN
jgi:arsenite-transporting ATPase